MYKLVLVDLDLSSGIIGLGFANKPLVFCHWTGIMMLGLRSRWLCIYPSQYKIQWVVILLFSGRTDGDKSFKWFKYDNLIMILLVVNCPSYKWSENVYEGYSPLSWTHKWYYLISHFSIEQLQFSWFGFLMWSGHGLLCKFIEFKIPYAIESMAFWLWFLSLQSVGFTGASGFTLAVMWLVSFGVALIVHHCFTWTINLKWKGSKHSQKIRPILLILFTCAST